MGILGNMFPDRFVGCTLFNGGTVHLRRVGSPTTLCGFTASSDVWTEEETDRFHLSPSLLPDGRRPRCEACWSKK